VTSTGGLIVQLRNSVARIRKPSKLNLEVMDDYFCILYFMKASKISGFGRVGGISC
jgi:hypothetical protein